MCRHFLCLSCQRLGLAGCRVVVSCVLVLCLINSDISVTSRNHDNYPVRQSTLFVYHRAIWRRAGRHNNSITLLFCSIRHRRTLTSNVRIRAKHTSATPSRAHQSQRLCGFSLISSPLLVQHSDFALAVWLGVELHCTFVLKEDQERASDRAVVPAARRSPISELWPRGREIFIALYMVYMVYMVPHGIWYTTTFTTTLKN